MRDHIANPIPQDARVVIRVPEGLKKRYAPRQGGDFTNEPQSDDDMYIDYEPLEGRTGYVWSWYPNGTDTPGGTVVDCTYFIAFDEEFSDVVFSGREFFTQKMLALPPDFVFEEEVK